ncbi:MAG: aryl-sulfate sulfotransferase [Crocinitomicaceae bacterium]|nr:aryl-sulfate sulfotransferase [Crocinitomicaceae bacterium]
MSLTFAWGQSIIPEHNKVVNYTQILFQTTPVDFASIYEFQFDSIDGDFSKPIFQKIDSTHVTIVNGFEFGGSYKWKVNAYDQHQNLLGASDIFNFKIRKSSTVDDANFRFRVIKSEKDFNENEVIFLDYSRVAINRKGEPVWFMPALDEDIRNSRIRDMKMTGFGTITYLTPKSCREVTIDNQLVWQTPSHNVSSNDSVADVYHHEFTKTSRNTYLVLSKEFVDKTLTNGDQTINQVPITVVKEYDQNGEVIWYWSSLNYITDNDLLEVGKKVFLGNTFGHANSVSESKDGKKVYVGFRDLNSILCVNKESNKLIFSYGDKIPSDTTKNGVGFFKKQHAAIPYSKGKILVFNNNIRGSTSSVIIFSEANDESESQIIWEFPCDFDTLMPGNSDRMGNAEHLKSDGILVNMGSVARLFEVNPEKKVTWDCLPEQWNQDSLEWRPYSNYRLNHQSSLYPKYASISLKKDINDENYISICNEGTDSDDYKLIIKSKKGKILDTVLFDLNHNQSYRYYLSKKIISKGHSFEVISESTGKTYELNFSAL